MSFPPGGDGIPQEDLSCRGAGTGTHPQARPPAKAAVCPLPSPDPSLSRSSATKAPRSAAQVNSEPIRLAEREKVALTSTVYFPSWIPTFSSQVELSDPEFESFQLPEFASSSLTPVRTVLISPSFFQTDSQVT